MKKNFYFFGDSICFGQYESVENTFVLKVAQSFNEQAVEPMVFMNPSVCGNTTRLALERLSHDVLSRDPYAVYIQFGMNDCNQWDTDKGECRVFQLAFKMNLIEIYNKLKVFDVKHIFFGTNHQSNKNDNYDSMNTNYNISIREVCSDLTDCHLIDNEKNIKNYCFKNKKDEYLLDGVHLNTKGHEIYAKYISNYLIKYFYGKM